MERRFLSSRRSAGPSGLLTGLLCLALSASAAAQIPSPGRRPFGGRPGGRAGRPLAPTPVEAPAPAPASLAAAEGTTASVETGSDGVPLVNLDFQNGDLRGILKILAELTKTNYLYDDAFKGTVNLVGPRKVPLAEAVQLLESLLEYKGFAVVPLNGFKKIVPRAQGPGQPIETLLPGEEALGGSDSLVTRLLHLQHTAVADMKTTVAGLLSNPNALIAVPRSNTLILTENRLNVDRVARIIGALDTPVRGKGIHVVPLVHSGAKVMADRLTELLKQRADEKLTPETQQNVVARPVILPDERTNSLVLVCLSEDLAELKELVARLDKDVRFAPATRVLSLRHADARTLAGTVKDVLGAAGDAASKALTVVADERTNAIVVSSMSAPLLDEAQRLVEELDSEVASSDQIVQVHHLEFAEAEHLAEILKDFDFVPPEEAQAPPSGTTAAVRTGGKPAVVVRPDKVTNALIITCPRNRWPYVEDVIRKLDIVRAQVMVEVLVVELDVNRARQLGLDFNILDENDTGNRPFALGSTGTLAGLVGGGGIANGLSVGILTGNSFDWNKAVDGDAGELSKIAGIIRVLHNDTKANILSSPQLLTSDNETAKISVGEQIQLPSSYSTAANSGLNTITSFSTEDLGILLEITPRITKNDHVQLKVAQTVKARTSDTLYDQNIPVISKRNLETTITVRDTTTVAIGGLISETKLRTETRIPVLSELPLVGKLFGDRRTERRKTNLMIFLTPHILRGSDDAQRFTARQRDRLEDTLADGNPALRRRLAAATSSTSTAPASVDELVDSIMGVLSGGRP